MMTWRLWRALFWPFVEHPIYRRIVRSKRRIVTVKMRDAMIMPSIFRRSSPLWGFFAGAAMVFLVCSGGWLIVLPLVCLAPLLMVSVGTLCGLICAIKTSTTLTKERQDGKFDLLGLAPSGITGATWAVCSAIYHNSAFMTQLRDFARGTYLVLTVGTFFLFGTIILNSGTSVISNAPINFSSLLILAALYIDLVQSILVGSVIGMIIPTYVSAEFDARGLSLGAFLALQFLTYIVVALINFFLLNGVFDWQGNLVISLVRLGIFYLTREVMIVWLWGFLARRLESDLKELNEVARISA